WMQRKDGRFLLTRRAPTKGYPLMWETTGGSSASGESSLQAALREAQEEAGMQLDPQQGKLVYSYMRPDHFKDVWVFDHEAALDEVILQEGETVDARLATMEEILELYQKNELVPYTYLDTLCRYLSSRS
ncbi:MAG: NUDIX domain-containing protein, partial [Clostridia bacterium]|nr:NUDIX domain-containing protein [Clostridia bacterium]